MTKDELQKITEAAVEIAMKATRSVYATGMSTHSEATIVGPVAAAILVGAVGTTAHSSAEVLKALIDK